MGVHENMGDVVLAAHVVCMLWNYRGNDAQYLIPCRGLQHKGQIGRGWATHQGRLSPTLRSPRGLKMEEVRWSKKIKRWKTIGVRGVGLKILLLVKQLLWWRLSLLPCICHNRVTWSSSWWDLKYLCTNPGPCRVRKFFLPMTRSRRYGSPPWLLQDETSSQMLDKKIQILKFIFFNFQSL